jgi:hypothetical protein
MLFYPKLCVLVSMLEYLSTTYLLCLVVIFSIETYYSNRHLMWCHCGRIIHVFVWGVHQWLARRKESTLALFFFKLRLLWKPDAITTCFWVCTFNLCKIKEQKIKAETWKQKHETAKWNYKTLLSCGNAKTILSCWVSR